MNDYQPPARQLLLARKFALDGQACRIPRLETALDIRHFESKLTHLISRRWENLPIRSNKIISCVIDKGMSNSWVPRPRTPAKQVTIKSEVGLPALAKAALRSASKAGLSTNPSSFQGTKMEPSTQPRLNSFGVLFQ